MSRLVAVLVEPGGLKHNIHALPLARPFSGIYSGRRSLVDVMVGGLALGAWIHAPAMSRRRLLNSVTVEYLDFMVAMKYHAGVRSFGHHKFHVNLDITVIPPLRNEAGALAFFAVDQDSGARRAGKASAVFRIQHGFTGHVPFVAVMPCLKAAFCVSTQGKY